MQERFFLDPPEPRNGLPRLLGMRRRNGPQGKGRDTTMNKLTKIAAVAVAALTISVGTLATSNEAHAFGKKGFGLGIAAAVIGTSLAVIAANAGPRCKLV